MARFIGDVKRFEIILGILLNVTYKQFYCLII